MDNFQFHEFEQVVGQFNSFHITGLFPKPNENIRKFLVFWCFLRVYKETRDQWHEMGRQKTNENN